MLYLALVPGEYIGWGVCSKYLIRELEMLTKIEVLKPHNVNRDILDGEVFHTIGDHNLTKVRDITGRINYGYTFFENVLADRAKQNALHFDLLFAGSTWCRDRLVERGVSWSDVLIQGIDPELFYPVAGDKSGATDYFVIYSGGKFELRKGQDIVIRAVKVMQDRHKDVLFVNCWHNAWPFSMNTMVQSPFIHYRPNDSCSPDVIKKILSGNGIDLNRTEILPPIPQNQLRKIYEITDVGLFPNRCEGGTNLVLMEYMACGKPVVASYNSGHRDVISEYNSIPIMKMRPFRFKDRGGEVVARWEEPNLEETIEGLEYTYQNKDKTSRLGQKAGEDMNGFTWRRTAEDLVTKIRRFNPPF